MTNETAPQAQSETGQEPILGGRTAAEWAAKYEVAGGCLFYRSGKRQGEEAGWIAYRKNKDGEKVPNGRKVFSSATKRVIDSRKLAQFIQRGGSDA